MEPSFDYGNILATGLGLALPGVGGIIGNLGAQMFNAGTSSTKSQFNNNLDTILGKLPDITRESGYNAAGKVGAAVESSYANAKSGLTNTAEARNAYDTQNNLAGRMLTSLDSSIDSANKNAQSLGGSTVRNLTRAARDAGGGAGAISAIADKIGENTANTIGQTSANIAAQSGDVLAKAGSLTSQAQEGLMRDLQQQYDLNVKPYEMQVTNHNVLGNANQLTDQSVTDTAMYQPLAGLSNAMGALGGQYMGMNQGNIGAGQMSKILEEYLKANPMPPAPVK